MKTKCGGKRRRRDQGGTGTTIMSAGEDIDQEAVRAIESAAIGTKTVRDRAIDDGTMTETISADIDREAASTNDEMSDQSGDGSEVQMRSVHDRAQRIEGVDGTQGAGHHMRDLRGGETEEL